MILTSGACIDAFRHASSNNEGMIQYKISYPAGNSFGNISVLPGETTFFFKDAKASFITTSMGMVQMVNLLDNDKKEFTSLLLNTVGENYAFIDKPEDVKAQENQPEYNIVTCKETKTIAGLECNKAVVSDLTNNRQFDIYYYKNVKVYLGNSPYKDFNYLLMEYQDTKYGLPMILHATKVDLSPVDTTMLSVHGEFTWVDKNEFISVVKNLTAPI